MQKFISIIYSLFVLTTAFASEPFYQSPETLRIKFIVSNRLNRDALNKLSDKIQTLSHHTAFQELSGENLNGSQIELLSNLLPKFSTLEVLRLKDLDDNGVKILAPEFPSTLQELDLSDGHFTGKNIEFLSAKFPFLPYLNSLNLSNNRVEGKELENLISSFPTTLRILRLCKLKTTDEHIRILASKLSSFLNLQELDLDYNLFYYVKGMQALAQILPTLTTLKTLKLSLVHRDHADILTPAFQTLSNLEELSLTLFPFANLNHQNLLSALPTSLQVLCLRKNIIGNEVVQTLRPALSSNLRVLGLYNNKIDDNSLKALISILPFSLQELFLSGNKITDEGLQVVCSALSSTLLTLQKLTLDATQWTSKGTTVLFQTLRTNLTLNHLTLHNLKVTEQLNQEIEELLKMNFTLQNLTLEGLTEQNQNFLHQNMKRAQTLQVLAREPEFVL